MAKPAQKMNKKHQAQWEEGFRQAKQLIDLNRLQEAKQLCEQLLANYGEESDILNLMGVIHYRGGDPNGAIGWYKRLLDNDPNNAEALFNLANLLMNLGYRQQAMEMYESVLTHEPEHLRTLKQLNKMFVEDRRWPEVFVTARRILSQEAWHDDVWPGIAEAIDRIPRQMISQDFLQELDALLKNPSNNPLFVIKLAVSALCYAYPLFDAYANCIKRGDTQMLENFTMADWKSALDIPLLHTMLRNYTVPHEIIEKLMIMLRRCLLNLSPEESPDDYYALLLTLAYQGHVNEFVCYQAPEEQGRISALKDELENAELTPDDATVCKLLIMAAYQPLSSLKNAASLPELAKKYKDKEFREFVALTISEILEERNILPAIPTIGTIDDAISQAVQGQYEQNPYPRWIDYGDFPAETMEIVMRRLYPEFDQTQLELSSAPDILIAGCGTGKHAVGTAQRFANSHVTAVDLSRASLAYAIRKSREYGYNNIEYFQADILKLGELNRQFDIVESAGVLHHMRDPMAGWRVITDLLKPGGLMKIGLYSAKAREDITAMRQEIKDKGYGDSPEEIRRFRHELMQNPQMREQYGFSNSNDFYSLSECRDLLFHRQEHCFTIPKLKACLQELGLRFIGFETSEFAYIKTYMERFPEDKARVNLENWEKLEEEIPKMFFGMYQFWCYKPL